MDEITAQQAIIDRLTGDPRAEPPPIQTLPEPWRTVYERVGREAGYEEASVAIWRAILSQLRHTPQASPSASRQLSAMASPLAARCLPTPPGPEKR